MSRCLTTLIALGAAAFLAGTLGLNAVAQYRSLATGTTWNNPGSALLDTMIMNNVFAQGFSKELRKPTGDSRQSSAAARTAPPAGPGQRAVLSFRPAARSLMVEAIAEALGSDAQERNELRTLFTQFLDHFDQEARKDKMPRDVPRATAAFIAFNYGVAVGEEVKSEAIERLRNRVAAYLLENAQYRALTDGQKQQLYETLVILGTLAGVGYNDGQEKKNEKQMEIFRKLGRKNLETLLGVPFQKLKLTRAGFRIE